MKVVLLMAFLVLTAHCVPVSNLRMSVSANELYWIHSELLVIPNPEIRTTGHPESKATPPLSGFLWTYKEADLSTYLERPC